jgi:FkbM family methyltransferase
MHNESNLVQTSEGHWVLRSDTHLSRWIEHHRRLDIAEGELLPFQKYIPVGGTVLDVGASLGDHTATYANFVGPTGKVIAFEPNPDSAECLRRNMAGYPNVLVVEAGLSDSTGTAWLERDANVGASHLTRATEGSTGDVRTVTLDDFVAANPGWFKRLDFVKIDAEGFEPFILDGATKTLVRFRPVLMLEVNQGQLQKQAILTEELLARLSGAQYKYAACSGSEGSDQWDALALPR